MSDACGYDPDWWKVAKATSIERKRRTASSRKLAKLGDTFLVVTEGVVTEPVYFEFLLTDLQLYAVHVVVMPGRDSDPRHVIETAADESHETRLQSHPEPRQALQSTRQHPYKTPCRH